MEGHREPPVGGDDRLVESSILADPRHRRIVAILSARSEPLSVDELSARLAAREASDRGSIRIDLRHRCLPKLETVGWIERRRGGLVVDEPFPLDHGRLSVPDVRDPEHPDWEAISALLARSRRLELASLVADRPRPVSVEDLAAELSSGARGTDESRPAADRTLFTELRHVDLPKLDDVGLIEYDAREGTVAGTRRLSALVDADPDAGTTGERDHA